MLNVGHAWERNCGGMSRRELLQVGGVSLLGLSLPQLLSTAAAEPSATAKDPKCIFIWLSGGPSHFETFDPKPLAPERIRGPYGPISTSVPGLQISQLLPQLARQADRYSIIRSLHHQNAGHNSVAMSAGYELGNTSFGAVVTKLRGLSASMPSYVHVGSFRGQGTIEQTGLDMVGGGEFGSAYEPIVVRNPMGKTVEVGQFNLSVDVPANRFQQRQELLSAVEKFRADTHQHRAIDQMDTHYRKAVDLLTSTRVRDAFDVRQEPERLRMRYGANFFGQSCILARRLIEAGTKFVQIKWYDCIAFDAWDVHGAELPGMSRMEQQLCPRLDQGLSALLDDLHQRGLLDSTLVVVVGEFGRTPDINKFGARDHWPFCFSGLLAGAGIPGGAVVGSSDKKGAYPATRPVRPEEFAATIYKSLGIDVVNDLRIRRFVKDATPINELVS